MREKTFAEKTERWFGPAPAPAPDLTERMLDNMVINTLKEVIADLERLTRKPNPAIQCPSTIVFLADLLNDARAAYTRRTGD